MRAPRAFEPSLPKARDTVERKPTTSDATNPSIALYVRGPDSRRIHKTGRPRQSRTWTTDWRRLRQSEDVGCPPLRLGHAAAPLHTPPYGYFAKNVEKRHGRPRERPCRN